MDTSTSGALLEDYFSKCLKLLYKYRWVYEKPNTHLFANKILDNIPLEWSEYFHGIDSHEVYNNIALGIIDEMSPLSFQKFIEEINTLKPNSYKYTSSNMSIENTLRLNQKKIHEILHLAPIIHSNCTEHGIHYIIDIGAGLGYLPQLLFDNYGYNILGIEGNIKYVEAATKQQSDKSRNTVKYKHLFVKPNSGKDIEALFQESFPNFDSKIDSVCIVALHACADLTVHIINIFHQITFAKCAVIMPCCYHRLEGNNSSFYNFPLSKSLKHQYSKYSETFFTRSFLRLACQQSSAVWKDMTLEEHTLRARNCALRNVLQEVVDEEGVTITRRKRKTGGRSSDYKIDKFISDLGELYTFTSKLNEPICQETFNEIKFKILNRYSDNYSDVEPLIEAISAIQASFQGICENLILMDRCSYAKELELLCCIHKVTDDSLSPRCFALLASKE